MPGQSTATPTMPTSAAAELRLWQLISPTLPVGAYAYSAGLETAVDRGWVHDEDSFASWSAGQLAHALSNLDVPVLARMMAAWAAADQAEVAGWSRWLLANRETGELRAEDRHLGRALARLLVDLGEPRARDWRDHGDVSWATLFALAAVGWGISPAAAARGYLWAWLENQVAAAVKLVPLGQSAGQRTLLALADRIEPAVSSGLRLADEDIGAATPGLALASSWHETQYTRLFRS